MCIRDSKWTDVSTGGAYIEETGQVLRCINDTVEYRGYARSTNEITETNISLHFSIQFDDTSDASGLGAIHWDGLHGAPTAEWDLPHNAFAIDWMNSGVMWIDEIVTGTVNTLENITRSHDLNWHDFQLRHYNGPVSYTHLRAHET